MSADARALNRIVVGTSGSGKTTFARRLARKLGCSHVELDSLHWQPNWVEAPLDVFRARVADSLSGAAWVVDGNYSKVRDITWSRAEMLVWLDYPFRIIFARLLWRTLRRVLTREGLWNGNRETIRGAFIGRESLFVWAITSHPRHRREYPVLLQKEYAHLRVVRLPSVRKAEDWLEKL